jgi:hypothetical protein
MLQKFLKMSLTYKKRNLVQPIGTHIISCHTNHTTPAAKTPHTLPLNHSQATHPTTTHKLQKKNYKQEKISIDSSPPPTKSRIPTTTPASHPYLRQTTRLPTPPVLHHTPPIQRLVRLLTLAYPLQLVVEPVKVQMVAVVVAVAVVVLVLGESRVVHAHAHAHTHAYTRAI